LISTIPLDASFVDEAAHNATTKIEIEELAQKTAKYMLEYMGLKGWSLETASHSVFTMGNNHGESIVAGVNTDRGRQHVQLAIAHDVDFEDEGGFTQIMGHEVAHVLLHDVGFEDVKVMADERTTELLHLVEERLCERIGRMIAQ
jgi:hypothetical protein